MDIKRVNHLTNTFYVTPTWANMTMSTREWQETAAATGGEILSCGHVWDIVAKRLAPGIYKITLKLRS